MLNLKVWSWDKAVEGMQVFLVTPKNFHFPIKGVVSEIERNSRRRMVDGKPVISTRVVSVTIKCEGGRKIKVTRAMPKYQIMLQ